LRNLRLPYVVTNLSVCMIICHLWRSCALLKREHFANIFALSTIGSEQEAQLSLTNCATLSCKVVEVLQYFLS